tara:strand:+ start:968 stop:1201 length:234 start_codon:yes stop_codon:yes gene_type:complete
MKNIDGLKLIIRHLIQEEQGQLKVRNNKGYGAASSYYVNSRRPSLGHEENLEHEQEDPVIKISRAFIVKDRSNRDEM